VAEECGETNAAIFWADFVQFGTKCVSDKKVEKSDSGGNPLMASWIRQYALVLEFLGMLAVLGYVGYRLDLRYGWSPWGLFGGLMTALVAGVYRMLREGRRLNK